MKKVILFSACISAGFLTGCSSIVNGSKQSLSVVTSPVSQAHCVLENDKGTWRIKNTPGRVLVHRSQKDLKVTCDKKGYLKHSMSVKSKTGKAAYGNILLGGAVGAAIDRSNGAAFEYPMEIHVPLKSEKISKN